MHKAPPPPSGQNFLLPPEPRPLTGWKVLHYGGSSTAADVKVKDAHLSVGGSLLIEGILAMDNSRVEVQGDTCIVPENRYSAFGIRMHF